MYPLRGSSCKKWSRKILNSLLCTLSPLHCLPAWVCVLSKQNAPLPAIAWDLCDNAIFVLDWLANHVNLCLSQAAVLSVQLHGCSCLHVLYMWLCQSHDLNCHTSIPPVSNGIYVHIGPASSCDCFMQSLKIIIRSYLWWSRPLYRTPISSCELSKWQSDIHYMSCLTVPPRYLFRLQLPLFATFWMETWTCCCSFLALGHVWLWPISSLCYAARYVCVVSVFHLLMFCLSTACPSNVSHETAL
jgi:hypothetical protein